MGGGLTIGPVTLVDKLVQSEVIGRFDICPEDISVSRMESFISLLSDNRVSLCPFCQVRIQCFFSLKDPATSSLGEVKTSTGDNPLSSLVSYFLTSKTEGSKGLFYKTGSAGARL